MLVIHMCGCPYSTNVLLFGCLYLQRSNEWYRLMSLILAVDTVLSSPACICRRRKSFPRGLQMCKAFSLFFVVFKLTSWSFTIKQKISCVYIQLYVRGEEREKGREKEKSLMPNVMSSKGFRDGVCFIVVDKRLIHTSGASFPSCDVLGLHHIHSLVVSQYALCLQGQGLWCTTLISYNLLFRPFFKGSLFGRLF